MNAVYKASCSEELVAGARRTVDEACNAVEDAVTTVRRISALIEAMTDAEPPDQEDVDRVLAAVRDGLVSVHAAAARNGA